MRHHAAGKSGRHHSTKLALNKTVGSRCQSGCLLIVF